jgi:hypothetical protein
LITDFADLETMIPLIFFVSDCRPHLPILKLYDGRLVYFINIYSISFYNLSYRDE